MAHLTILFANVAACRKKMKPYILPGPNRARQAMLRLIADL